MLLRIYFFTILFIGNPISTIAQNCSNGGVVEHLNEAEKIKKSDPAKSEQSAEKALSCSRKLDLKLSIIKSLNILGFHHLMSGRSKKAHECFQESLNLAEKAKDTLQIATANNNLGNYYNYRGLHKISLEYYLTSLKLKREINYTEGIDVALVNIGIVFDQQGKHKQALEHYEQALVLKKASRDNVGVGICYENMGIAHAENHAFGKASECFDKALAIYEAHDITRYIISVQLSAISAELESGNSLNATSRLKKLEPTIRKSEDVVMLQIWHDLHAKLNLEQNRLNLAHQFADSSLNYAEQSEDISLIISSYNRLAELEKVKGNEQNLLRYTNTALKLKDSLNQLNNRVAIEEMQLRYESNELQNKINLQQKDIELLNLSNRLKMYSILLVGSIALLIIGSLYFKYRRSENAKRMLNEEVNIRNKELLSYTVRTAKKNEAIQKLKKTLNESINDANPNPPYRAKLFSLFKEIEQTEDHWKVFRLRFEKIDPTFFEELSHRFKLTETDLRICALIKLNVTTQEAANMLNITADSVNKSRYRLRKKLNLPKEVELNSFIQTIS